MKIYISISQIRTQKSISNDSSDLATLGSLLRSTHAPYAVAQHKPGGQQGRDSHGPGDRAAWSPRTAILISHPVLQSTSRLFDDVSESFCATKPIYNFERT